MVLGTAVDLLLLFSTVKSSRMAAAPRENRDIARKNSFFETMIGCSFTLFSQLCLSAKNLQQMIPWKDED